MSIWQRPLWLKERSEESVIEFRVLYLKVRHPAKPLSKNQIQFLCLDSLCFHLLVWPHSKADNAVSRNANRRHLPEFDKCLAFSTLLFQAALLLPQMLRLFVPCTTLTLSLGRVLARSRAVLCSFPAASLRLGLF